VRLFLKGFVEFFDPEFIGWFAGVIVTAMGVLGVVYCAMRIAGER
jgi:hypothetical protein